jgi:hypothetical protein
MTATAERVVTLSRPQAEIFDSPVRWRVLIAGRRFGKSFVGGTLAAETALNTPQASIWYTGPTYKSIKLPRGQWDTFKQILGPWLAKTPNETDLRLELVNGSTVVMVSRQNPDNVRGAPVDRFIYDEFCVQAEADKGKATWEKVFLPMLADTGGDAVFLSTPTGYNWGHEFYERGQDPERPDWASWQFTTLDGGRVDPAIIEAARRDTDPRSFAQEWEARFTALADRVYDYFDRQYHVDESVQDTGAEILVGQDFNVNPMASVIAVKVGDECHVLDALELPASNTQEVCDELNSQNRYKGRKIIMCPDPSANQRRTSAPAGETDITIIKRAGITVDASSAAPHVADRINNVQAMLQSADGRRRIKIHPRAKALIKGLEGMTYKLWQRFNLLEDRTVRQREFLI